MARAAPAVHGSFLEYCVAASKFLVPDQLRSKLHNWEALDVTEVGPDAVSHLVKLQHVERGRGLVAAKDLAPGEVLFVEQPFAYLGSVAMLQQGSLHLVATRNDFAKEYEKVLREYASSGTPSPETSSWANAVAFYGAGKGFRQDEWGTNLKNASKSVQAPGYAWSQRQLRIFQKAMELEDSFRLIPQRLPGSGPSTSPMPSRDLKQPLNADHTSLLGSAWEEGYVVGLESAEGKKLNGDHGPIMDHHLKFDPNETLASEYRCSVLFEETGQNKRIKRSQLKTFPGVVQTNAFEVDNSAGEPTHILCSLASRFNHSCVPNCGFCPVVLAPGNSNDSACNTHLVLVALQAVPQGTELTMNYLNLADDKQGHPFLDVTARRHRLARRYNFVCECELCLDQCRSD